MRRKVKAIAYYMGAVERMFLLGLHQHTPRFWTLLGGEIERRETAAEALAREIREESDNKVDDFKLIKFLDQVTTNKVSTIPAIVEVKTPSWGEVNNREMKKLEFFSEEEVEMLLLGSEIRGHKLWPDDKKLTKKGLQSLNFSLKEEIVKSASL
jgi:ADP-ribose pyrophosphatase YjhB (NUDIX family)